MSAGAPRGFALSQSVGRQTGVFGRPMIAIVYRCPATGLCVDHWFEPAERAETYETVPCRACNGIHLVNVTTGRVLVPTDQGSAPAAVCGGMYERAAPRR
jgi:hypothetical protein